MKFGGPENSDEHANVAKIGAEDLDAPSQGRVRDERTRVVPASVKEEVFDFERTDHKHGGGLDHD